MNKYFTKILFYTVLVLLIIFSFLGCAKKPEPIKIMYKTKVEKVTIPKELLKIKKIPKPIEKDEYVEIDSIERENELTKYIIRLLHYIKIEHKQLKTIKKINERHSDTKGE